MFLGKSRKRILVCTIVFVCILLVAMALSGIKASKQLGYAGGEDGFSVSDGVINGKYMEFVVTRTNTVIEETVDYRTISGTAIGNVHFIEKRERLFFMEGDTQKTISIEVKGAHEKYNDNTASQYTNIDRVFYLQLYNASRENAIENDIGQAVIYRDTAFSVDNNYFQQGSFYSLHSGIIAPLNQKIFSSTSYYESVGSQLSLDIELDYVSMEEAQQLVVGLKHQEGGNAPIVNVDGIMLGDSDYIAAVLYNNSSDNSFYHKIPFDSGIQQGWGYGESGYMYSEKAASNVSINDGNINLPLQDYFVFAMFDGSGFLSSFNVQGRIVDQQEPKLLGIAPLIGSYNQGDNIYVSLIFDEIVVINGIECTLNTDRGDFEYVGGAHSNVLVFKGQLTDTNIDEIEILGISQSISDYAGNNFVNRNLGMFNAPMGINSQQYTVAFYDKKEGEIYDVQLVDEFEFIVEPAIPFRLGYQFDGWKDNQTDEFFNLSQQITKDIILYASWTNYFMSQDALGTETSPFLLSTYEHLQNFSFLFSEESCYYEEYKDKYYKLNNNIVIDIDADSFSPVGVIKVELNEGEEEFEVHYDNIFQGTFDGDGYFIENIKIDEIFGSFININDGVITSLGIRGEIMGVLAAAGFTIVNTGRIEKCINRSYISTYSDGLVAGISFANFDMYNYELDEEDTFVPKGNLENLIQGQIIDCINIGTMDSSDAVQIGISGVFGIIKNCFNFSVFEGIPITERVLIDEHIENCFYSSINFKEYSLESPELGTALNSLDMIGENTSLHTNILYNALSMGNNDWVIAPNEGDIWHLPNLAIFADKGMQPLGFHIYRVRIEFDDDLTADIEEDYVEGDKIDIPSDIEKVGFIFMGWFLVEDNQLVESELDFAVDNMVIRAKWSKYYFVIEESSEGKTIVGIEIAEQVEDLEIIIDKDIFRIGNNAFDIEGNTVISSIVFEEDSGLISIGKEAFKGTSITALNLPSSLQNIDIFAFWGISIESIEIVAGGKYVSIDGVLYSNYGASLFYYPYAKNSTDYILPPLVTHIGDYAFISEEQDGYYYGNPYIEYLEINQALVGIETYSLYGLSALSKVTLNQNYPAFSANSNMFYYYNNSIELINNELIIEIGDYDIYLNYITSGDMWWESLNLHYSYLITITFDYNQATGNNTEEVRTRVNGDEDGDLIRNGSPIGILPRPYRFGYNFVEWQWDDDGYIIGIEDYYSFFDSVTIYATWTEWVAVSLSYDQDGHMTINDQINDSSKTIEDIILVETVTSIYFDNIVIQEQAVLSNKTVVFNGAIINNYTEAAIVLEKNCTITANELSMNTVGYPLFLIKSSLSGYNELVYSRYAGNQFVFEMSQTSDIYIYADKAVATLPNDDEEEYNIIYWDVEWESQGKQTGEVGRNKKEIFFDSLASGNRYSPIAQRTVTINIEIEEVYYNKEEHNITYTTNRDLPGTALECKISYYSEFADREAQQNEMLSAPYNAGTYYYIVSREGYNDFCDAEEIKGEYTIKQAQVMATAISGVELTKEYDSWETYYGDIIENVHYVLNGIFVEDIPQIEVEVISKEFNSVNVAEADKVIVELRISDSNYIVNQNLEINAYISPKEAEITWEGVTEYIYQAQDLSTNIKAFYYKLSSSDKNYVEINFSGTDNVFKNVGLYSVTAYGDDDNYLLTETTQDLEIVAAQITVAAIDGVTLTKAYDGKTDYLGELFEGVHYTVNGILSQDIGLVEIDIFSRKFNSINVVEAHTVVLQLGVDSNNYVVNTSLEIAGEILPYQTAFIWVSEEEYVYQATDLSDTVQAYFEKINETDYSEVEIEFSGRDNVFYYAGSYVAMASCNNANYTYTNAEQDFLIKKAKVTVSAVNNVVLSKEYDGNVQYLGALEEIEHYVVDGIVDDAYITIGMVRNFNSANVEQAYQVTTSVSISNTSNYDINSIFEIAANIIPVTVSNIQWSYNTNYVYDECDYANTVSARFIDINGQHVYLDIAFSGQDEVFMDAGEYTATANTNDKNYQITNNVVTLLIGRKDATIEAQLEQVFVYDTHIKNISATLNHNEVDLLYQPQQGYVDAGSYNITIIAEQSNNYNATSQAVVLKINKAEPTNIYHQPITISYFADMRLADIILDSNFYWLENENFNPNDISISAGQNQSFAAYYNLDANNYVDYFLTVIVNVDKALSIIEIPPIIEDEVIIGKAFYNYNLIGGQADIDGVFKWPNNNDFVDTTDVLIENGDLMAEIAVAFDPSHEYSDNYAQTNFTIKVAVRYLQVTFNSYEHQEIVEAYYNQKIDPIDFPNPTDKVGYFKSWGNNTGAITVREDRALDAVYTLLPPVISIEGYSQPVIYGEEILLTVNNEHELSEVEFSYMWYYNNASTAVSSMPSIEIRNVNQSGEYKVIVQATDGQQVSYADDELYVHISKADSVITANLVQEYTYDGEAKNVIAILNHNETELNYSQFNLIQANEEGYIIDVIAQETANYLPTNLQVKLIIEKAIITGVVFESKQFEYDKQTYSIALANENVAGILSVTYVNNEIMNVGSVEVTAIIEYDSINYHAIESMFATITITPRPVHIAIPSKNSIYGQPISYEELAVVNQTDIVGNDELGLIVHKEEGVNAGDYRLSCTINNPNYQAIVTEGVYTILKATINMQGVEYKDKNIVYDISEHSLTLSGQLPGQIQQVLYSNNQAKNAGVYNAVATFVYDKKNYELVEDMVATLTIFPREITINFSYPSNLFYDGETKECRVNLIGILTSEVDIVKATIAYNKNVKDPGYYTAQVSINSDNYVIVGDKNFEFIIYQREINNTTNNDINVIMTSAKGFLPDASLDVTSSTKRKEIASGTFSGKEAKQTFIISLGDKAIEEGDSITIKLLIDARLRHIDDLSLGRLNAAGELIEISFERQGDYIVFATAEPQGEYIIIGEGKGSTKWVIVVAIAGVVLAGAAIGTSLIMKNKKKKKSSQIIG